MRIFLTGATGFVGSAILPELHSAGHQVLALARSEHSANAVISAGAKILRGDLRDPASLRKGAEEADAVIHAAFDHDFSRFAESCEMDRQAIEILGTALEGTGKKLIVTSGLPVIEDRAATERDAPPAGAHGIPRVSEQTAMAFRENGVDVSVIRMPQVHDRERQGFASYLMSHAREAGVSAYVGTGENRWPAVHRLDAARLYKIVLDRGLSGSYYHAVAEEGVPVREVAEVIGTALDVPVKSVSVDAAPAHFGWLARIAQMDVPASSALTRIELDWKPVERDGLLVNVRKARQDAVLAR
ncbi:SDR family oxidoreductase [Henriciella aquimarina]|uniref:SDR family oxidoreductase n=1 Tax=Henriciella aquimarina TaxID=545261 RepID=UPI000A007FF5|nr:SDR family oxidoreductase [Henriciella aquimarina]